MLKNFKKGFGGDYGVRMTPGKLRTLCELEWTTYGADWPAEGTLHLPMVRAVYQVVTVTPGSVLVPRLLAADSSTITPLF